MEDEIRRRSACDRCHSQKLRCPKREGADMCNRCAKMGAPCRYSPFRQKKNPDSSQGDTQSAGSDRPNLNRTLTESNGAKQDHTALRIHKRKRLSSPTPEENTDLGVAIFDLPDPSGKSHDSNSIESEWCIGSSLALQDVLDDSNFAITDFENQFDYPSMDFSLPPTPNFRDYGDKMGNLLQIRSPPPTIAYSLNRGQSWSPLPEPSSMPSQLAVSRPTPQIQHYDNDARRHQKSICQCIEQLSKLSFRLYEHSQTIPPQSVFEAVPENASFEDVVSARAKDYTVYRVDDTFQLTQDLVDVYPSFIDLFMRRKILQTSHLLIPQDLANLDHRREELLGPIASSLSNPLAFDHPSVLLMLSCHLRLVEIYEELLKHMTICIDQKGALCMSEDSSFTAPRLRIGNYVPPSKTAVPMQMLLLLHFATSLRDHAVDIESLLREPQGLSSSTEESDDAMATLSLASAEKVKDRAIGMLQGLNALRATLLKQGRVA